VIAVLGKQMSHFAHGAITCHNALQKCQLPTFAATSVYDMAWKRTLRDWVAGAAMVVVL